MAAEDRWINQGQMISLKHCLTRQPATWLVSKVHHSQDSPLPIPAISPTHNGYSPSALIKEGRLLGQIILQALPYLAKKGITNTIPKFFTRQCLPPPEAELSDDCHWQQSKKKHSSYHFPPPKVGRSLSDPLFLTSLSSNTYTLRNE